jgi:hypothetical protein
MALKAKKSKAVESSTPASWSVAQFSSSFFSQLETVTLMLQAQDKADGGNN